MSYIFFEKLLDKKNDKIKFKNVPERNEEHISVSYWFTGVFDGCRFYSSCLGSFFKTLVDKNYEVFKNMK